MLVGAVAMSFIWCGLLAFQATAGRLSWPVLVTVEVMRNVIWLFFLLNILGNASRELDLSGRWVRIAWIWSIVISAALVALLFGARYIPPELIASDAKVKMVIFGLLMMALTGLALVEQLFRNTRREHHWAVKFLCSGLGALFAYDFFLYSDALLLKEVDAEFWDARGAVNALVVPLIAVAAARNPRWSPEIFVSRHVVFHTAAVLGAGSYLIVMAGAGYYLRLYGGSWGVIAQTVFLVGAVALLFILMFSGQLRAREGICQ